jgi:hypothetical protein
MTEEALVTTTVMRSVADSRGTADVSTQKERKTIKARRKFRLKKNRNIEK